MSITRITPSSKRALRVLLIVALLIGTPLWTPPSSPIQAQAPAASGVEEPQTGASAALLAEITVCPGSGCDHDNVQDAIDAAAPGDVIKIAAGVYTDTAGLGTLARITQTLTLRGGYDAAFTEPPDPVANPTVLDGEHQGQVAVIEGNGITATLSGLTLQRGSGSASGSRNNVYVSGGASLVITNSQVLSSTGNGFYLHDAGPSEVQGNIIAANGGLGLESVYSAVNVTGNTFTDNNGGLYMQAWKNVGLDSVVDGNTLLSNAYGAIYVYGWYSSTITVTNNVVSGHDEGIHIYDVYDTVTLTGNTITDNVDYGVVIRSNSRAYLDNNIIAHSGQFGIDVDSRSSAILRHNTLFDNATGVRVQAHCSASLTNTIIASSTTGLETTSFTSIVTADHTLWHAVANEVDQAEDSTVERTNDVYGDPRFVGGVNPFDAYHIDYDSAAVDAGRVTGLLVDIDGAPRALPDIGVDEYPNAVKVTPDSARPADAGATVVYTHTLRNTGSDADTFSLDVASGQGWTVGVEPASATLDSGETAPVTVTLTVPSGAPRGQIDTTVVTATAQADTRVFDTAHDVTTVGVGLSLAPDRSAHVDPGASWTYTHTLTNLGSELDTFDLAMDDPLGWASLLTASPVTLAADGTATVEVEVTVPLTGATGVPFTAVLTATSQTAPYPYDSVVDTTWVNPVQSDRYVVPAGSDWANNCTDPTTPCAHLHYAVGQAQPEDTIKVATGIYTDTLTDSAGYLARIDRTLAVRGGYEAAFSGPPDPAANPSVLDGEYEGQVLIIEGSGITVTLTGLTIQRGDGNTWGTRNNVRVTGGASLVITNSRVISATERGLFLEDAGLSEVRDNVIAGNGNSGLYAYRTPITVTGNTVTGNNGGMELSAWEAAGVDAFVEGNTVVDNNWAGIYVEGCHASTITVINNVISGHEFGEGVYGYYTYDHALVSGNVITGNERGIYMFYSSHAVIDNNIIVHNTIAGVYANYDSHPTLRHNTLSDNPIGVEVVNNSSVSLTNTIVASSTYALQTTVGTAAITADHTLFHANTNEIDQAEDSTIEHTNDVHGDPRFVGGADPFDAYHVDYDSAAVDAGRATGLLVDIEGEPRALPDIGVDEYPNAVKVRPDYARITGSDTAVTYLHTLHNSGTVADTFTLAVASSQGWPVGVEPASAMLASGETAPVTVTVSVPPGAMTGDFDTTVVTATAQADSRVFDTAYDETTVGVGLSLAPDRSAHVDPGASWTYTHTLTNLGSGPDTFDLAVGDSLGWASLLTASPITVTSGATATVEVQVTVPLTGATGVPFTAILTATSQSAPQPSDLVADTTWVNRVPGDRYLSSTGSDSANNCTDPATPCALLRHTVDQSWSGDVVYIATGVYTDANTDLEDRLAYISRTLTLRGGYDAAFSGTPDPVTNPSVLDAERQGEVLVIDGSGISVTLTGLTIQQGGTQNVHVTNGASLVITNCRVVSATQRGIRLEDAGPSEIRDSVFRENGLTGIDAYRTPVIIAGNTLVGNFYGMELSAWETTGVDSIVEGNTLNNQSGNIYVGDWLSSTITIAHNVITGEGYGDGIYSYHTYDHLTLTGNTVTGHSYGIFLDTFSDARLDNNIIAQNTDAGVYVEDDSHPVLRHNTLSDNLVGVQVDENSSVSLTNTIVASSTYGLQTTAASAAIVADHTLWHATANYSDTFAGSAIEHTNDVAGNPRFLGGADPFAAYHIEYDSAAVEAGIDAGLDVDIDGDPRPRVPGRLVAIGADERATLPPVADAGPDRTVVANEAVTLDGSASNAPNGDYPLDYLWAQTGGPAVVLSDEMVVSPTFTTPFGIEVLTFTLIVTDSLDLVSAPDEVVITVRLYEIYLPLVVR